ncbi:MAG: MOSC domain-containing protein [Actinomycetota bacterium]|nr:MOSC domain-containing protein [Actinomycetota bacterium]
MADGVHGKRRGHDVVRLLWRSGTYYTNVALPPRHFPGMLCTMDHVELNVLQAGLARIRRSPKDQGRVELIVRRPAENEREMLAEAVLDCRHGLLGDSWWTRGSSRTRSRGPNPGRQLTLMNARVAALVAGSAERWQLAGDQLYVDLDLSCDNLPPGTRLALGSAVIEVSDQPHRGCQKFASRFGVDALRFVNSDLGNELNLRGINASVVVGGLVRPGDAIRKTSAEGDPA